MQKVNVNTAIKRLAEKRHNGILPLNDEALRLLVIKHPEASPSTEKVLLEGTPKDIHPIRFEMIDAESVKQAAIKT